MYDDRRDGGRDPSERATLESTPTADELVPELRECVAEAQRQVADLDALVAPIDDHRFGWRPDQGTWSIAQHLMHMTVTGRVFLGRVAQAVDRAWSDGLTASPPYRHGWFGRLFTRIMEPPPKFRMKTFGDLKPVEHRPKHVVVSELLALQSDMIRSMYTANGIDLGRARVPMPFTRLLKMSVGQTYRFLLAHNRRHMWHVRRLSADPELPRPQVG